MSVTQPTLIADRLACIEADLNLRHTSVRWLAHEAAYPGLGALNMITPALIERDRKLLAEVSSLVDEMEEKAPDDDLLGHFRWVRDELQEVC